MDRAPHTRRPAVVRQCQILIRPCGLPQRRAPNQAPLPSWRGVESTAPHPFYGNRAPDTASCPDGSQPNGSQSASMSETEPSPSGTPLLAPSPELLAPEPLPGGAAAIEAAMETM